jgi:branched-chain amino acid transport system substrate-binding protein
VVGSVHTPMATTDYLPFMQPIKETGADAIFLFVNAGRTNAAVKAFAGSGLKQAGVQLMGPGDVAIDDEIATMSDDVLDLVTAGVYLTSNPRPQNQDFVRAWKAEYGRDALPNFMAAAGWDGMAAIYALVRETKGEFTGDTAMKFLAGWKNPDSPRGSIAIDPQTRDIVQTVYINRVQKVDGKPTNVTFDSIADVRDPWKRLNPQ